MQLPPFSIPTRAGIVGEFLLQGCSGYGAEKIPFELDADNAAARRDSSSGPAFRGRPESYLPRFYRQSMKFDSTLSGKGSCTAAQQGGLTHLTGLQLPNATLIFRRERAPTPHVAIPTHCTHVLCDLDGTLVRSEPEYRKAMVLAAKALLGERCNGHSWVPTSPTDALTTRQAAKAFMRVYSKDKDTIDWRKLAKMQAAILADDLASFDAIPGAVSLVKKLSRVGKQLALVTNSLEGPAARALKELKIEAHFDHLITAETSDPKHKPNPKPYEIAMERFGLSSSSSGLSPAVALEDSATGVIAAYLAGVELIIVRIPPEEDDSFRFALREQIWSYSDQGMITHRMQFRSPSIYLVAGWEQVLVAPAAATTTAA